MFGKLFKEKPDKRNFIFAFLLCFVFFVAYGVLSVVRHNHYQSFGYDLGINDQTVWRYSTFQPPLTTIDAFPDKLKLYAHIELVYALISPFYWIWSSRRMLLLVEAAFVCFSGLAIYLLARDKKLKPSVNFSVLFTYLAFFGVQNAIWFDVHSASFAAAFLCWFLYFLNGRKKLLSIVFFILAITSKENVAFITFAISLVYFIKRRDIFNFYITCSSIAYLFFVFFVYFPFIIHFPYLYQGSGGLFSSLNPMLLFDTGEKLQTIFYTFFSFGFLPLLNPLLLLPILSDLATYFIIGNELPGAQGLYMHYRITLAPLLAWATILVIAKYKKLNSIYIAIYLLILTLFIQYSLHLPLSYLAKSWFWKEPTAVKSINLVIKHYLPKNASVVAQNNIVPHISHRDKIFSLFPDTKHFDINSPCNKSDCEWLKWYDDPEYLLVDTSADWDTRHILMNREEFLNALQNLEKTKTITVFKRIDTTTLYKINKIPLDN